MKEYTLEEIEAMVDALPKSPLKSIAKKAMRAVDKAGIPKTTKIIDSDERYTPPTGRPVIDPDLDEQIDYDVKSTEKIYRLSDEEVTELLKEQEKNGG